MRTKYKIEIRQICDIRGNCYKIYELLAKYEDKAYWKSIHTDFSMEDLMYSIGIIAGETHNIPIHDKTKKD